MGSNPTRPVWGGKMEEGFDPRGHVLVPEHRVLSEEEKEEILRKYKVKPHQLPLMKSTDPVARAIGAKPGDIVEVKRESPTAGRTLAYRYVVEG
ncbi:MAG: DNA-directed RNA polymerase subunit H [Candidatus Hadarchaeales archaeon]